MARVTSLTAAVLAATSLFVSTSFAHRGRPDKTKTRFSWDDTKYVLAFGDSYTYVQGTHGRQNATFIGDYLDFSYEPEELLTDMIVQNQTGTAEGGPNWVEHLTGCGLEPGLTSPLSCERQLWDFAFGGADISIDFTPLHHDYSVQLVNQTQQFLTYGYPTLRSHHLVDPKSTLVAIWIGINDINDSKSYNVTSFPAFYSTLQDIMFTQSIQPLYAAGYRNFLLMNLPPLDLNPANARLAPEKRSPNATMINWWNAGLASHATSFQSQHRDSNMFVFDANTFLNAVIVDGESYGLTNVTGYCPAYNQPEVDTDPESYGCEPLSSYFWFNAGHMTSRVHEILAEEVDEFLSGL